MINIPPFLDRQYKVYSENVKSRNKLHYLMGLYVRWKQHFKYERAVRIARKHGAKVGEGAVISSGSVVAKNVEPMSVVSGNPVKELRKRKCVHSELVVESLLGGDYLVYKISRNFK